MTNYHTVNMIMGVCILILGIAFLLMSTNELCFTTVGVIFIIGGISGMKAAYK